MNFCFLFYLVNAADNVKKWWIWGYWSSPLMYAQNAIVVNEFLGKSWSKVSSRMFHVNICVYLCVSVTDDCMYFHFSECYRFNRIPWSYSIEVSWVLHRRTLVLDRSWGTAWIHICVQLLLHSVPQLPKSWVSLPSLH